MIRKNNGTKSRMAGFITKIEQRSIGGPSKRRYWFAVSEDSPYLYWYKNRGDMKCIGRISLYGAAFTFNPRETGRFEIHFGSEEHILETSDNKSRLQWLHYLQYVRRMHYENENSDTSRNVEIVSLSSHSVLNDDVDRMEADLRNLELTEIVESSPEEKSLEDEFSETCQSQFYLSSEGELNEKSLKMPSTDASDVDLLKNVEEFLQRIVDETQAKGKALEMPAKRAFGKARSFRFPSLANTFSSKHSCTQCDTLLEIVNNLKDRCYELTDELGANHELASTLKQILLKANRQIDALKKLENLIDLSDRVNFILERESLLVDAQMNSATMSRQIQNLKQDNRLLEEQNEAYRAEIEAFRESIRSKEALIVKLCNEEPSSSYFEDESIPEAILIDISGVKSEESMQQIFDEASVTDVNEMRDLVHGYRNQNMFLNQEVLELQKIVKTLEEREKRIVRRNFDIEACYYQMKSRYMTVLNHFKTEKTDANALRPGVIEALIDEANDAPSNGCVDSRNKTRLTDSLGFYLNDRRLRQHCDDILDVAAGFKNVSDEIVGRQEMERNPQYIEWLLKWDSFLVNNVSRPLKPSIELKMLVRTSVPKTYRKRVWKSLVSNLVSNQRSDLGNGYYELLAKKRKRVEEEGEYDSALKQIELDLARTLPNNKYFDEPSSEKIEVLRKVLSAYRFHNKTVGYCQGLNRLAAIALLFLDDSDAFWFLVACIEYLQPPDYYTASLSCSLADQKVLRDLVGEKLPRLSCHLKKLDVDLPAFTLSWFLTCFVDVFPQSIYLPIFDVFLYEGNKVLFRFALALLKIAEPSLIECKTIGAVHASLSKIAQYVDDFKALAEVAFNGLSSFPMKSIEVKRQFYLSQLRGSS